MSSLAKFLANLALIPIALYPQATWSLSPSQTVRAPHKHEKHGRQEKMTLADILSPKKTVGEIYDTLKVDMNEARNKAFVNWTELSSRNWRSQKNPLTVVKSEGDKFTFHDASSDKNFLVEFLGQDDVFARVNGKDILNSDFESTQRLLNKLQLSIHAAQNASALDSVLNLLIPRAHADFFPLIMIGVLAAVLFASRSSGDDD